MKRSRVHLDVKVKTWDEDGQPRISDKLVSASMHYPEREIHLGCEETHKYYTPEHMVNTLSHETIHFFLWFRIDRSAEDVRLNNGMSTAVSFDNICGAIGL